MKLIDGKRLAEEIRANVKDEVSRMNTKPNIGVLLIGNDPASHLYVSLKEKAAKEVGIKTDVRRLPAETTDEEIKRTIAEWNEREDVHAILIQLPLPEGHDTEKIINAMDPKKDVDGFHPANVAALKNGEAVILSPVHEAVVRAIGATGTDPREKRVTILANSETFASPLAFILQKAGCLTAIMHPDALDEEILKTSDIIVTAVGRAGFLGADLVRDGATVIDVGTSKDAFGKTRGDADAETFKHMDGWITPVPGGIGPMTVALLLKNAVQLARDR